MRIGAGGGGLNRGRTRPPLPASSLLPAPSLPLPSCHDSLPSPPSPTHNPCPRPCPSHGAQKGAQLLVPRHGRGSDVRVHGRRAAGPQLGRVERKALQGGVGRDANGNNTKGASMPCQRLIQPGGFVCERCKPHGSPHADCLWRLPSGEEASSTGGAKRYAGGKRCACACGGGGSCNAPTEALHPSSVPTQGGGCAERHRGAGAAIR